MDWIWMDVVSILYRNDPLWHDLMNNVCLQEFSVKWDGGYCDDFIIIGNSCAIRQPLSPTADDKGIYRNATSNWAINADPNVITQRFSLCNSNHYQSHYLKQLTNTVTVIQHTNKQVYGCDYIF